jgi:hypothetical protein
MGFLVLKINHLATPVPFVSSMARHGFVLVRFFATGGWLVGWLDGRDFGQSRTVKDVFSERLT